MPKIAPELPALHVKRLAKRPGFHAVGGVAGLHLVVRDTLAASWILRKKVGSRRVDIGLGGFPSVTLETARDKARVMHEQASRGIDPIAARKEAQAALRATQAKVKTFDEVAKLAHQAKAPQFRNRKHAAQWISTLTTYASPEIGTLPVSAIELPHVLDVLKPIWNSKTETATRLRERIEAVLAYATVNGYRNGDNPARWKGNLEHALPRPSKIKQKRHHPALPWQEMGLFMEDLRSRAGIGPRALEFLILTSARPQEVRFATWDEIDLNGKLWTAPGQHMKRGRPHRVPLTEDAVALLRALPRREGTNLVFPSVRGKRLSDGTLAAVVKRMHEANAKEGGAGYVDPKQDAVAVPHGFRSSFKDWARSCTSYPDEVTELALAHVNDDATRAAYARDELLAKRTRLMRDWAKFISVVPKKAAVVPLRATTTVQ